MIAAIICAAAVVLLLVWLNFHKRRYVIPAPPPMPVLHPGPPFVRPEPRMPKDQEEAIVETVMREARKRAASPKPKRKALKKKPRRKVRT